MSLFGTSGIRGIYGSEVTPQLAMDVGAAAAERGKPFLLCRDCRGTSPVLCEALAAGAMSVGANAIDIGIGPTPILAFAAMQEECNGAMITASHNPPQYNGMKLFCRGVEFTGEQETEVEGKLASKLAAVDWNAAGQKSARDYSPDYISFALLKVDARPIAKRNPRVLVDAGNAAAYSLAPRLLQAAGCEVVRLNCDSPGKMARELEPKAETLEEAAAAVADEKCDFGVAFDGDGDRAIAIDERGKVLAPDVQLSLFASYFLSKTGARGKTVVSTVEASLCVKEAVEAAGGKLEITPVGSGDVAKRALETGAVFGGEPCGEYVFPGAIPCADGLLASLFIAEIFCAKGKLSALAGRVKTYPIERRKYGCGRDGKFRGRFPSSGTSGGEFHSKDKGKIMAALERKLAFPGASLSKIDGLRYDFRDGWLLVRPSGTEPAIRLTCEFRDRKRLEETTSAAEREILAATG
jgi:phosphomannomutase